MVAVSEVFNVYKAFREWQKEYNKNNDKDLYIHRLENLLEKAEKENEDLKNELNSKNKNELELSKNHYKVIKLFPDLKCGCFEFMIEEKLENIDMEIAFQDLKNYRYIVNDGLGDDRNCIINQKKLVEILKLIKKVEKL